MGKQQPAKRGRVSPTAPASESLSGAVWSHLESIPGFNEGMKRAQADFADGKGTKLKDTGSGR